MSGPNHSLARSLVLLLCLCGGALAQETDHQRVVEEILSGKGYQRELPGDGNEEALGGAAGWGRDGLRRRRARERELSLPVGGEGLGLFGWVLLATLAGVVIVLAVRGSAGGVHDVRLTGTRDAPGPVTTAPAFDPGDAPLSDAERLARDGRFGEAIRVLLHRTFEALSEHQQVRIAAWMTSRQILQRARLADDPRRALGRLVTAVEGSLFARREPDRTAFQDCQAAYRALLDATRGGPR